LDDCCFVVVVVVVVVVVFVVVVVVNILYGPVPELTPRQTDRRWLTTW